MNTLQEKVAVSEAIDKGLSIQYSETDGETDDWEDLKTTELDFTLYTYRVKPSNHSSARFKVGDRIVNISDEGKFNPHIFTVKGFDNMGNYLWEETYNRSPIDVTDANDTHKLLNTTMEIIRDVQEYYKGRVRDITPMYSMGFRLPITNKETNK